MTGSGHITIAMGHIKIETDHSLYICTYGENLGEHIRTVQVVSKIELILIFPHFRFYENIVGYFGVKFR